MKLSREVIVKGAITYFYIALWITLSGLVIMFNKYILVYTPLKYPVLLTMCHMGFSSLVTYLLVSWRVVASIDMPWETYSTSILPIAGLFALVLWLGNAAYEFLSVSFIQMLKALMPVSVYSVSMGFGLEKFNHVTLLLMVVITTGVGIASVGELLWDTSGVLFQLSSIVCEAIRLNLVQILIQRKGLKLNPVTTLYYLAPASLLFLSVPFFFLEYPVIRNDPYFLFDTKLVFLNCTAAFCLNLSVLLLIGRTSALTMNVSGVIKDWLLIGLSAWIYRNPVTKLNLIGYSISFVAVAIYNQMKIRQQLHNQQKAAMLLGPGGGGSSSRKQTG